MEYTGGDLSLNSGTWADLPTVAATKDITLAAQVGDVVAYNFATLTTTSTQAFDAAFDVWSIVAAAAVRGLSGHGGAAERGVVAWYIHQSINKAVGGWYLLTPIQAGDIASGFVTMRIRYRQDVAGVRGVTATASAPMIFQAENLGPQDPN